MSNHKEVPITRVLIGFASAHGSTKEVAVRIGEILRVEGFDVDVREFDEIDSIDAYGAAILGSAIHGQKWLPLAADFIRAHSTALTDRPVWLFSVCSIGDTSSFFSDRMARLMRRRRREPSIISEVRSQLDPRDHRYFAGVIERSQWTVAGDLFLRLCGGTFGDHRDWPDIERWASGIAISLQSAPGSSLRT